MLSQPNFKEKEHSLPAGSVVQLLRGEPSVVLGIVAHLVPRPTTEMAPVAVAQRTSRPGVAVTVGVVSWIPGVLARRQTQVLECSVWQRPVVVPEERQL